MLSWMRDKLYIGRQKIGKVLSRRSNDYGVSEESDSNCNIGSKMLVEDSNLFPDEKIKLYIIGVDGSIWTVSAPPDISIATLKSMALSHFYNPVESTKHQQNYKLVVVSSKKVLSNENSIQDEQLRPEEEILLVERRLIDPKENLIPDDVQKGPSPKEVLAATENLTPRNIVRAPPTAYECTEDFQTEFRKILVSLVEVAAQLLSSRSNAYDVYLSIVERLETRDKIVPDRNAIKNLTEMGFVEDRVILALRLKRNNPTEALEWLLEKGASKTDMSQSSDEMPDDLTESSKEKPTVVESVSKLLSTFRMFRRKEFRPNVKALQAMLEMGFQEKDIVEALRITGNNQCFACEWLLGERSENLQDLDNGLDREGPIFKAMLANPTIQLGLNNPRMLLAAVLYNSLLTAGSVDPPSSEYLQKSIFSEECRCND